MPKRTKPRCNNFCQNENMTDFYEGVALWSQMDANRHMRHSAYADIATQARIALLEKIGLTPTLLLDIGIGPVMFREELIYLKEITLNEHVRVTCLVSRSKADGSRYTFQHEIFRADGVKAATVTVDGAWLDLEHRKLVILPDVYIKLFMSAPRTSDYTEVI